MNINFPCMRHSLGSTAALTTQTLARSYASDPVQRHDCFQRLLSCPAANHQHSSSPASELHYALHGKPYNCTPAIRPWHARTRSALASCLSDSFKWSSAMVCMVRCVVHEWSSALPALTCWCSMGRNSIEREKETYWKVIRPFFSTFEESLSKIWHTCNQTVLLLQSLF